MPFSSYALIVANFIPLIGVLFYQWDAVLVLALFWIENLIIGLFNIFKMLGVSSVAKDASGLFVIAFFFVHYGLFCTVHGMLLTDLLGLEEANAMDYFANEWDGLFGLFQNGAVVFLNFVDKLSPTIWVGIAGLLLSRFVSFIEHFILRGELYKLKARKLMAEPYGSILVMHVGLIAGAMILQKLHSPVWLLAIIVLLKLIADYSMHSKRHKTRQQAERIKDL